MDEIASQRYVADWGCKLIIPIPTGKRDRAGNDRTGD